MITVPTLIHCFAGPSLYFRGQYIANRSAIQLSELGEGDNALFCLTDKTDCCRERPNRFGEFYYPNRVQVPNAGLLHDFYRDRGNQFIRLNRREWATGPIGRYCCNIPDVGGAIQKLCVNLE